MTDDEVTVMAKEAGFLYFEDFPPSYKNKLFRLVATANAREAIETSTHNPAEKRAFFAPEGYRRLTINLREDLHKKLKREAIEQDCTATEIIERLLSKELEK